MRSLSLLSDWTLREEALSVSANMADAVLKKADGWLSVPSLPCDVHTALHQAGIIGEPLVGGNSFDCLWVEDRSWWFCKRFTLTKEQLSVSGAELFIEMLDIHADLFLNGRHIGHHASAMYPFCRDVLPFLCEGENTLLIRLTVGLERVSDEDVAEVRQFVACEFRSRRPGRGEEKRVALRKPQYVFGWDQAPRLGTCAIAGDVRLDLLDTVVVRDLRFETLELTENGARLLVEAEIESRQRLYAKECEAVFTLEYNGEVVHTHRLSYLSQPGIHYCDFSFTLEDPALWWPNGYGEQNLYTARVTVCDREGGQDEKSIVTGVRTVRLDMSDLGNDERRYAFFVNGKKIYCKGMDYIQVNCLYAEATDQMHERLLTAARDASFNMLRFWDGNLYQSDFVHALCDRYGLLVIENFCFACGAYPDHLPEFQKEVEREAVYQLRRLRSHPCVALWYGNGECHGLLGSYLGRRYFDEYTPQIHTGGTYLYNDLLPRLHRGLVASVGYQCCTPFGGFEDQQTEKRGDMHYYPFLNLAPDNQQYRISAKSYEDLNCKFITESGVMGPPSVEAITRYCGGRENTDFDSPIWEHHRNTFERLAVRDAIHRHFTGVRELSLEEYCHLGGLFQADLLSFAADRVRLCYESAGSLFWCFTDGFGEIGFSVMDHDQNPKPAYYGLRRAYAPCRLLLSKEEGVVRVYAVNDTAEARDWEVELGYTDFTGEKNTRQTVTVHVPAFEKLLPVGELPLGKDDLTRGVFYAKEASGTLSTAFLRGADFCELEIPKAASLTVTEVEQAGDALSFTVTADCFAYAVHFSLPAEARLSDCYFHLLPGESKRVTLYNAADLQVKTVTASCLFRP